jgi:hypothetical protein
MIYLWKDSFLARVERTGRPHGYPKYSIVPVDIKKGRREEFEPKNAGLSEKTEAMAFALTEKTVKLTESG